jgi:chromate transporter
MITGQPERPTRRLLEVGAVFLRLGLTAFGGPAAHIAIMHDEIVKRRKWIDDQHFLDLLGATNLIPGPNSTEMAIHIGYVQAGWPGLIAGGLGFILPTMLIVLGMAWAYVTYGSLPAATWLLDGTRPVIIALIAQALWTLGQTAIKGRATALVVGAALALYFAGVEPLALMLAGGVGLMVIANWRRVRRTDLAALIGAGAQHAVPLEIATTLAASPFSLWAMFLAFLKIGAVLYGSGYVLFAFLQADFVTRTHWISQQQLLDAIAVGQVTPGPLSSTATFIGYVLGGVPGALIGTLGIFLPSFVFVAISNPLIPRVRQSAWAGAFLDGVNAAALGLMAAVTVQLGASAFIRGGAVDWIAVVVGIIALGLLVRWKVNSIWLVLGGAALGLIRAWLA